ncbi:Glycosyltransferase [Alloactinosynnema sp. L-07]|nr:Glycosyltransferase [Alloactinosynnema sp. L-07]
MNGTTQSRRPLVTILAPAFNEADNAVGLVGFFREIRAYRPDMDFELVVVDDGSVDNTAEIVKGALRDGDVARVATLSRNFGSHAAITAGLALSRGDAAITVSTDLQEPVEAIGRFIDAWQAGNDIVWGLRQTRAVPKGVANWMSRKFSVVFTRMADGPTFPQEGPSQALISRAVIDVVNQMPERNRNVMGMVAWTGFTQTSIYFEQLPRPAGKSKWTNKKKIRLVIDSFVEFSSAPFLITFLMGLGIGLVGILGTLATLLVALISWTAPVGWLLVLSAVFFFAGLQLSVFGGLGEYTWRAGDDARRRPVFILRAVHDSGVPATNAAHTGAVTARPETTTAH